MKSGLIACALACKFEELIRLEVLAGRPPNKALVATRSILVDGLELGIGQKSILFLSELLIALNETGYFGLLQTACDHDCRCEVCGAIRSEIAKLKK